MSMQRVCGISDVEPAAAIQVKVPNSIGDRVAVAIVRDSDGSWHALGDTCTHANVSLAGGEVEDGTIECWKHGSPFDLATGRPLTLPATEPVPVYTITVRGDDVFVDVDSTL